LGKGKLTFGYGDEFMQVLEIDSVNHFLILSAGIAIPQKAKEAKPPDKKIAVPVDIYHSGKQ